MDIMYSVPNIPADDAPLGNDEHDNIVIKTVGKKPEFKFEPLDHIQLLEKNNWADFTGAANVSGSRAYALRGDVARLEMALWMFAMDKLNKHGFTPITVPSMVREGALYGTGMFPGSRDEIYQLPNDDLYLAGTAEVALTSLHSGQMLTENQLPILYAGFSPCFRREAGSYGRDVRGLIRVHQFMKVEQFVICKNDPDESRKWHTALLNITMEILDDLNLHYQVVDCCTGDMGQGKVRMNDVNTWLPSQNTFRETHSCSTFHEYQSRRADLRYRENGSNDVKFCHTLNNTAVATPRILANILENYQNADGSVTVPEILRPYLGGLETLTPAK